MPPPDHPRIFHVTHVDNLREIVRTGVLWSDARRRELRLDCQIVGMATIKERRLSELRVKCHPGTMVGSTSLSICARGRSCLANNPELIYTGGPGRSCTSWVAFYADFRNLDRVNWDGVAAQDFRDPVIREGAGSVSFDRDTPAGLAADRDRLRP